MWEGEPSCKCPQGEQDCNEDKGWCSMKSQQTAREFDSIGTGGNRGHHGEFGGKERMRGGI